MPAICRKWTHWGHCQGQINCTRRKFTASWGPGHGTWQACSAMRDRWRQSSPPPIKWIPRLSKGKVGWNITLATFSCSRLRIGLHTSEQVFFLHQKLHWYWIWNIPISKPADCPCFATVNLWYTGKSIIPRNKTVAMIKQRDVSRNLKRAFFRSFLLKWQKSCRNHIFVSTTPISTLEGMISEKFFLSGYIHHNKNLHSKFYVSSFNSFGSALIC